MGTRQLGRVYAITDKDGKREVKTHAAGVDPAQWPRDQGRRALRLAINKVLRYDNIEDKLDNVGEPVDLTDKFNLPPDIHHNWKYVAFGPDGKLYVQVGANCNICEINPGVHGQIRRYNADGSGMEIVARGSAQHRRLRLAPRDEGAVVHRQRPRLGRQRRAAGRAQPSPQRPGRRQFRLSLLSRQWHRRSRHQAAEPLRRRGAAGRADGAAFRRPGHQVLHRQHVPRHVPERRFHRAARIVEPRKEVRLRRRGRPRLSRTERPSSSRS